ncbi:MAG TPA: hypothetical protein VFT54_10095, partial [Acidimicrobiia bacterium]|nr:hypothetical protein [Acidimicrobiia bacterium]
LHHSREVLALHLPPELVEVGVEEVPDFLSPVLAAHYQVATGEISPVIRRESPGEPSSSSTTAIFSSRR